jgi:hypothetical protein
MHFCFSKYQFSTQLDEISCLFNLVLVSEMIILIRSRSQTKVKKIYYVGLTSIVLLLTNKIRTTSHSHKYLGQAILQVGI